MVEMRRRQVDGIHHTRPFRYDFRPIRNTAALTAPPRPFLALPRQFVLIVGVQPAMFHHHITTFLNA